MGRYKDANLASIHPSSNTSSSRGLFPIGWVRLDGRLIRWEFIVGNTFSLVLIKWVNKRFWLWYPKCLYTIKVLATESHLQLQRMQ